jgi:hypothetical protein
MKQDLRTNEIQWKRSQYASSAQFRVSGNLLSTDSRPCWGESLSVLSFDFIALFKFHDITHAQYILLVTVSFRCPAAYTLSIRCVFTAAHSYALSIHCTLTCEPLIDYCLSRIVNSRPCWFLSSSPIISLNSPPFLSIVFSHLNQSRTSVYHSLPIHCLFTAYSLPIHCLVTSWWSLKRAVEWCDGTCREECNSVATLHHSPRQSL